MKNGISPQYHSAESGHVSLTDTYRGLDALLDRHAPVSAPGCLRSCGFADADEVRVAAKRMEIAVRRRRSEEARGQLAVVGGPSRVLKIQCRSA